MTNFRYKARDKFGGLAAGKMEADSPKSVAQQLSKQGFSPITINEESATDLAARFEEWFDSLQKIKADELVVFARQLASTLDAGVPLVSGLEAVAEQIRNRKFRNILLDVISEIEGGRTFSDALEKHHKFFPPILVNMVRGGEKAGILPQVLERISNILEKDIETADKIKTATRYPTIVLGILGLAFVVMSLYVIPKFTVFFGSFKTKLPLPTRILIGINHVMMHYWFWLLAVIFGSVYAAIQILRTQGGRLAWDRFILSIPIFGPLYTRIYLSRFGRMLSAMLGAGIPILDAMTITAGTIENKVMAQTILDIRIEVSRGNNLAEPMKWSRMFPPIAISMVAIGEKAGNLEKMLDKMADYFDREVDYTVGNLTPLLEPLLILGLAGLMLLFALGIFLPMWDLVNITKGM